MRAAAGGLGGSDSDVCELAMFHIKALFWARQSKVAKRFDLRAPYLAMLVIGRSGGVWEGAKVRK